MHPSLKLKFSPCESCRIAEIAAAPEKFKFSLELRNAMPLSCRFVLIKGISLLIDEIVRSIMLIF